jgi:hypothetical protein
VYPRWPLTAWQRPTSLIHCSSQGATVEEVHRLGLRGRSSGSLWAVDGICGATGVLRCDRVDGEALRRGRAVNVARLVSGTNARSRPRTAPAEKLSRKFRRLRHQVKGALRALRMSA